VVHERRHFFSRKLQAQRAPNLISKLERSHLWEASMIDFCESTGKKEKAMNEL
jgi:hypothetical protein